MEVKRIKRQIKIWWIETMYSAQISAASRFGFVLFIVSKLLRFSFFLFFLLLLESKTKIIAGYSLWQMILFFLTFTFVDNTAQLLFREVYRFRNYIINGYFDYILLKPYPSLLRSLLGGTDALDSPLTFITAGAIFFATMQIPDISMQKIVSYILLIVNALIIAAAFHIFVLSLGVVTTAVDNAIMLYRDLTQMGRIPIDFYQQPLRSLLSFVIPIGIMISFPAKALLGLLSIELIIVSFCISIVLFAGSLVSWNYALKHYASASS